MTDALTADRPTVTIRFLLDADAAPGLLSRLLQPFAKRDLIPDRMWSHMWVEEPSAIEVIWD